MIISWPETLKRLQLKAPDGKYFPAHTGTETDEELRELIYQLVQNCNPQCAYDVCEFRGLKWLSLPHLRRFTDDLNRKTCLEMLEAERVCRQTHDGKNCQTLGGRSVYVPETEN